MRERQRSQTLLDRKLGEDLNLRLSGDNQRVDNQNLERNIEERENNLHLVTAHLNL